MNEMTTPVLDFVRQYAERGGARFHMPGHKGIPMLGCEPWDLTEVEGADVLYAPDGILAESEKNATALFESGHSYYSAEGSTLCIKAMLALAAQGKGERPLILAARNAHKALIYAAALLDLRIRWLEGESDHLCRCRVSPDEVAAVLSTCEEPPAAVYLTSPDYLGSLADVAGIAKVCHGRGVPLLVDNAHGAYLKFLEPSLHPLDLGADLCCDSAHKTLPVLTGGAYLHVSRDFSCEPSAVRGMLALFASTSPSYLILSSLDGCNRYLAEGYRARLAACVSRVRRVKERLRKSGFLFEESEPLKIVLRPRPMGYTGEELAAHLRRDEIEAEFADGDVLVLMVSPENREEDFERLLRSLEELSPKAPLSEETNVLPRRTEPISFGIRRAMLSPRESVPVERAVGRICATPTVSCPPAIPIAVSGDVITTADVKAFLRYGIERINVISEENVK